MSDTVEVTGGLFAPGEMKVAGPDAPSLPWHAKIPLWTKALIAFTLIASITAGIAVAVSKSSSSSSSSVVAAFKLSVNLGEAKSRTTADRIMSHVDDLMAFKEDRRSKARKMQTMANEWLKDPPYGDVNTKGSELVSDDIESFKVAILQIAICKNNPTDQTELSVTEVMRVGDHQPIPQMMSSNWEMLGCTVICGDEPAQFLNKTGTKHGAVMGGSLSSVYKDNDQSETLFQSYTNSLTWTDFRNSSSVTEFSSSCMATGNAIPEGSYSYGHIIYAPFFKIKATATFANGDKLYTKSGRLNNPLEKGGFSGGVQTVLTETNMNTAPAEEATVFAYDARDTLSFYNFFLPEEIKFTSTVIQVAVYNVTTNTTTYETQTIDQTTNAFSLDLAYTVEGLINAYKGVVQPSCYPDSPATCTFNGQVMPYAQYNPFTLLDKLKNAFDVGFFQISPIIRRSCESIKFQAYDIPLRAVDVKEHLQPVVYDSASPSNPVSTCKLRVYLSFITTDGSNPQASVHQPQGAMFVYLGCFARSKQLSVPDAAFVVPRLLSTNWRNDAEVSLYPGNYYWMPLLKFKLLYTIGAGTTAPSLQCFGWYTCNHWSKSKANLIQAYTDQTNGFNKRHGCLQFNFPPHSSVFSEHHAFCAGDTYTEASVIADINNNVFSNFGMCVPSDNASCPPSSAFQPVTATYSLMKIGTLAPGTGC